METKEQIIKLLESTERKGIDGLIAYLTDGGFFESPASTKYHGCYAGGLADHSFGVYDFLTEYSSRIKLDIVSSPGQKPLPIEDDTLIIAPLLHDVCKMGAYIGTEKPYKWNRKQPKGHAILSIERIKKYIELTELEEMMIRCHMGIYGTNEWCKDSSWEKGEYPILGDHSQDEEMSKEDSQKARYGKSLRNVYYHNPICKVMYFCDELATLEEKAQIEK